MKILKLRFRNLNSLRGEWEIDLTDPQYAANGIFAITGPTGAGKSTILDAICLALYGRTPRLERVNAAGNEIMSRLSGDCFAEVTFQANGALYRANWSQRRARNKPGGALQPHQRQLDNATTNAIIASNISEVGPAVERLTGMDFSRFTRAMMLAQGGFAAFLLANADERAPLLEQITGTEIYSRISKQVHERNRQENERLQALRQLLQGITLLSADDEAARRTELQTTQHDEAAINARLTATGAAMQWRHSLTQLVEEITRLGDGLTRQEESLAAFAPQGAALERANRAQALEADYAKLTIRRQMSATDQGQLTRNEAILPTLTQNHTAAQERLRGAEAALTQSRNHLIDTTPQWRAMRESDSEIARQQRELQSVRQKQHQELADLDKHKQTRTAKEGEHAQKADELRQYTTYLAEHQADEWLVANLSGVAARLHSLSGQQQRVADARRLDTKARRTASDATGKLQQAQAALQQAGKDVELATAAYDTAQRALNEKLDGATLRELRLAHQGLLNEASLARQILSYEEARRHLADGAPCPLCGATDHPYAQGNIPQPTEYEIRAAELHNLIEEVEQLTAQCESCAKQKTDAANRAAQAQTKRDGSVEANTNAANAVADAQAALEQATLLLQQQQDEISQILAPLGISDVTAVAPQQLLATLQNTLERWQAHGAKKEAAAKSIDAINAELRRLDAISETRQQALTARRDEISALSDNLKEAQQTRREAYGARDPLLEEQQANEAVAQKEEQLHAARQAHDQAQTQLNNATTLREALQQRLANHQAELAIVQPHFAAQLAAHNFIDEAEFVAAKLPEAEREALHTRQQALLTQRQELQTRLQDRRERHAVALAQNVTDKTAAELQETHAADTMLLEERRATITLLTSQLAANDAAKAQVEDQRQNIARQQRECDKWDRLHHLIGSADGKKYRNFAQGLTFAIMVSHANRQLQKLTDRYLLVRDPQQPLELNVIDNYQAGETRSTKNLSGGESFIVSLALALGLSHMVSDNIRVDSLFLDEGFGTLDDEALDNALNTLAALQHEGKLIGVISHVAALKERIATQITVTPLAGGRSKLSGPGCTAITTN